MSNSSSSLDSFGTDGNRSKIFFNGLYERFKGLLVLEFVVHVVVKVFVFAVEVFADSIGLKLVVEMSSSKTAELTFSHKISELTFPCDFSEDASKK